jgi:Activator of Hsp90 ATPase homolog 1-like protein
MELSPITQERALRCTAEQAFELYTGRIGDWWDPRYTANAETLEAVTIEPRRGGRVFATHSDFGIDDWGEVMVWDPWSRLAHTFTLAQDPAHPSEVAVEFVPAGDGCTIWFAHGGWNEGNAAVREKFGDWGLLLDRFAALSERPG